MQKIIVSELIGSVQYCFSWLRLNPSSSVCGESIDIHSIYYR